MIRRTTLGRAGFAPANQRSSRRALSRLATGAAALVIGHLLVLAPAARAAPGAATCSYDGATTTVTVDVPDSSDTVDIGRTVAGAFDVSGTGLAPTDCGGATVDNTTTVNVTASGGGLVVLLVLPFLSGAVAIAAASAYLGRSITVGQVYRALFRRFEVTLRIEVAELEEGRGWPASAACRINDEAVAKSWSTLSPRA